MVSVVCLCLLCVLCDNDAVTLDPKLAIYPELDGLGVEAVFHGVESGEQCSFGFAWSDRDGFLEDDGAGVHVLGRNMDRDTRPGHSGC